MKSRDKWLQEAIQRQSNVDPIKRIPNVANFQGTLVKGGWRLTPVQRIGALIVGGSFLALGCFVLRIGVTALWHAQIMTPEVPMLIFMPFWFWFGFKITWNALVNKPSKRHPLK